MRVDYFDASALAKRYLDEPGSTETRKLIAQSKVATSRMTVTEIASALARCRREGRISSRQRDRAMGALEADLRSWFLVEITAAVSRRSIALLKRHPLRAVDALQLASCLEIREQLGLPIRCVVYDTRLSEAARSEGIETVP